MTVCFGLLMENEKLNFKKMKTAKSQQICISCEEKFWQIPRNKYGEEG